MTEPHDIEDAIASFELSEPDPAAELAGDLAIVADLELTMRARHVAGSIQAAVAARPELASSIYGVGIDALTTALANDPARVMEAGPWLVLIVACYNYVADGRDPDGIVAGLAAGIIPEGVI
jgi:hypothetical protein